MARKSKGFEEGTNVSAGYAAKLKGKWGTGDGSAPQLQADWGDVDPVLIQGLVREAGLVRGAVTMGTDRQGVGFTLAVFVGGEKVLNQWYRGDAEGVGRLNSDLEQFILDMQSIG